MALHSRFVTVDPKRRWLRRPETQKTRILKQTRNSSSLIMSSSSSLAPGGRDKGKRNNITADDQQTDVGASSCHRRRMSKLWRGRASKQRTLSSELGILREPHADGRGTWMAYYTKHRGRAAFSPKF